MTEKEPQLGFTSTGQRILNARSDALHEAESRAREKHVAH